MRRLHPFAAGLLAFTTVAVMQHGRIACAGTCEKWAGRVVSAQGVVEVKPAGETRWQAVKLNETYCPGDTIRTDRKSRADIALATHPLLRLDQNSTVTLGGMKDEKTSLIDMLSGAALFFSRSPGTWRCARRASTPASRGRSSSCRSLKARPT